MPSQGKIINVVNICLKQKRNLDFELNRRGVCAGLAALYIKYSLENKTAQFFTLLDKLANLSSDYHLGENPAVDDFIIQIEKAYRPSEYSGFEIQQGDLEKILHIGTKPLNNEFNLGLTTDESTWKELFKKISRNNRSYFIGSRNHAIAVSFQNGKYTVYDPNYTKKTKEFTSADELINEIKDCFDYKNTSFSLLVRIFANPNATPEHYPNHDELHQIAFAKQVADISSSSFAAEARDINTLKYLFTENRINYESLAKEYLCPEFNELLLQQPKSTTLKNALLRGMAVLFYAGNHRELEQLIAHYQKTYTVAEELNELKECLRKLLAESPEKQLILMKKEADCGKLLRVFDYFHFSQDPALQTNYNHLSLLTLLKKPNAEFEIDRFLSQIPAEQIIKQIQCATIANQHHVLNVLLVHLNKNKIDPQSCTSIFNKEVINEINATTLLKLFDHGFVANNHDPDLLTLCMQRKDKSIFQTYARSWYEQKQPTLWSHIEKNQYHLIDLKSAFGSAPLIDTLIFLHKNEHVKRAWQDDISEEVLKGALTTAILNENSDMCLFLQEKLHSKKSQLDHDTLEFLYKKALSDENLFILSIITQLNFNILNNTKDIRALLNLCYDYDDYTIIESCFAQATPKIKQIILETSLNWNIMPVIKICIQKEPRLFNDYLNESTEKKEKIAKLNRVTKLLPPDTLLLKRDKDAQKTFIKDCFKNKFFSLAKYLCHNITWDEVDLNELIQNKNESALIILLPILLTLKNKQELIALFTENNLLKTLDSLLEHDQSIEHDLVEQIFTVALAGNAQNLVTKFLKWGKITPQTPLKHVLSDLLKQAIEKGNCSVLESFIHSSLDFGLDFKELFLFSCTYKQQEIANLLLAKEFSLSFTERQLAIKQLFGELPTAELFETIYRQSYGRLYQFLLKTNIPNPRASLLTSIQNPHDDPAYQQTELYLNPLKRAVKEKNEAVFNTLFNQSSLPSIPDKGILAFLKDPIIFASVSPLFEKKYTLNSLISEAVKQQEWAVLAHLIEKRKLSDIAAELQPSIQKHGMEIVKAYLDNLEAHYEKTDVRPQLFKLLDYKNSSALPQLALPYQEIIVKTLERIELNMLEKQLDLNQQIYRYAFSLQSFSKAMDEVRKIFDQCQKIITEHQIDLVKSIDNSEVTNHLVQIKTIMAGHNLIPEDLDEEHLALLKKLVENPRFKNICEQEYKLYCLLKQFSPLTKQSPEIQEQFNNEIQILHQSLKQAKLPNSFVLPEIQPYLNTYQVKSSVTQIPIKKEKKESSAKSSEVSNLVGLKNRCIGALNYYLNHRDETLGYFSYFFDYYRGKIRAEHYKQLITAAQTEQELYLIEYAILVNINGTQLKKDLAEQLKYTDENTAKIKLKAMIQESYSAEDLTQLDQVIDSINSKANANDESTLFDEEIAYLKQIRPSKNALLQHSFFQPKNQEQTMGFWQWVASCFGLDYSLATANENRLTPTKSFTVG